MNNFITYRTFDDVALLKQFVNFLKTIGISYTVDDFQTNVNPLNNLASESKITYEVKIAAEDFEAVQQSEMDWAEKQPIEIEDGHYLLSFTNDELKDVLIKADEWSATDLVLAKKILSDRKIAFNDGEIQKSRKEYIESLRKPQKHQKALIAIGCILVLLGGAAGIFIGWYLKNNKKTLPDGQQVYSFSEADRKSGNYIFILGCITFVIILALRILL